MGGDDGISNDAPARALSFDLLRVIFDYCFSASKVRLASTCKDLFAIFQDDLHDVKKARTSIIFEMQTRARVMAADRGCYNGFGGHRSMDVWKVVMRRMGINPKFCTTEHECITRITQVLNKKGLEDLEDMMTKFQTFNMLFHQILVESAKLASGTPFESAISALLASHNQSGTQRTDRVMIFVDLCINTPPSFQRNLLENSTIQGLLKESMDVTNNPTILLQYMRFPNEALRYWSDVALKNIANS